jgi:hypothetical protein
VNGGGLTLSVQYAGLTTRGWPIDERWFDMTFWNRIEEDNVEV